MPEREVEEEPWDDDIDPGGVQDEGEAEEDQQPSTRRFQFSIASLLFIQTIVAVVCSVGSGLGPAAAIWLVFMGGSITLIIAGTVWTARGGELPAWVSRGFGLLFAVIVVFAVLGLLLVILCDVVQQLR
jgi:hypothetical protein